MCISPVLLTTNRSEGATQFVACRKCWQCKENRLNDYVGRARAEAEVSDTTLAVTLTYGTDHPHAVFLVYRDVQLMLKQLRKAGHKVRYIVAGEYGSTKGRAHWHCVLFFRSKIEVPMEHRFMWDFWSHGFSYFQHPDLGGFRYVLKYIFKDQSAEFRAGHFALSKKPVLGFNHFSRLGRRYALNGHLPLQPAYYIGEDEYFLNGAALDALLWSYGAEFRRLYGSAPHILPEYAGNAIELARNNQPGKPSLYALYSDDPLKTARVFREYRELQINGEL